MCIVPATSEFTFGAQLNVFLIARSENHLTAFPEGLGDDLPALRFVNVEDNRITTLEEKDIAPLHKDSVLVRMIGETL